MLDLLDSVGAVEVFWTRGLGQVPSLLCSLGSVLLADTISFGACHLLVKLFCTIHLLVLRQLINALDLAVEIELTLREAAGRGGGILEGWYSQLTCERVL